MERKESEISAAGSASALGAEGRPFKSDISEYDIALFWRLWILVIRPWFCKSDQEPGRDRPENLSSETATVLSVAIAALAQKQSSVLPSRVSGLRNSYAAFETPHINLKKEKIMEFLSKLFQENMVLREKTYKYEVDPLNRSWFVDPYGSLHAEMSHRILLKKLFPDDWKTMKDRGQSDGDIEEAFTGRLLKQGWIKIGELADMYVQAPRMNDHLKDVLQGFASALIKARDGEDEIVNIEFGNDSMRCMLSELANDVLVDF